MVDNFRIMPQVKFYFENKGLGRENSETFCFCKQCFSPLPALHDPEQPVFQLCRSRNGLSGALRLVVSIQVGPGARLREVKCMMEMVKLVIGDCYIL